MVTFPLESLLKNVSISEDSMILCSPSSTKTRIFGNVTSYPDTTLSRQLGQLIERVNDGQPVKLKPLVEDRSNLVFGCTELSMLAHQEGLIGIDTLQVTSEKIVREL